MSGYAPQQRAAYGTNAGQARTQQAAYRRTRNQYVRTYNPGMGRPTSVPEGVIALDQHSRPYMPWRIPNEWKPTDAPIARPNQRANTAELAMKREPKAAYPHFKFSFLSAGREVSSPPAATSTAAAASWVDPDIPYLSAGLGYGMKHRHHYAYRSRDMPARDVMERRTQARWSEALAKFAQEELDL